MEKRKSRDIKQLERLCPNIMKIIKHTFVGGSKDESLHIDIGLDYLQIMFDEPKQKLPVLCLISKENGTGKSTFLKLLYEMFKYRAVILSNVELRSYYNSSYAGKEIIAIDEARIHVESIEIINSLQSCDMITVNEKYEESRQIDFKGKIIISSNCEDNITSKNINRIWLRELTIPTKLDEDLKGKFSEEMGFFTSILSTRLLKTKRESRTWFNPELIA